jgi:threonine/homoserine/homoserine lactone efflux protein
MASTLAELIPLVFAAAITPGLIIVVILMLEGAGGVGRAGAFVAGAITLRLVQGLLFGSIVGTRVEASDEDSLLIGAVLLSILGLLLLIAAFRIWSKEEDPDAPPPAWMQALSKMGAGRAYLIGMAAMALSAKQWVFTISAVQVILYQDLAQSTNWLLFIGFVLVATLPLLLPVLVCLVMPKRAQPLIERWRAWLDVNQRGIKVAVSVIFGLLFLYQGVKGLIA